MTEVAFVTFEWTHQKDEFVEKYARVPGVVAQPARAEELRLMMAMTKPKHFLPIHGEYRHLVAHSKIAASMGIPISNIHVIENNDVLELFDNFSSKTIRS